MTLYGTVRKPDIRKTWKSRRPIAEAWLEDASGKIKMMWFSQPYIAKTLHDGMVVKVSGKRCRYRGEDILSPILRLMDHPSCLTTMHDSFVYER